MDLGLDQLQGHFEKLQKLPRAYRMALLPAIAALVGGLYVYLFYVPTKATLEQARQQQLQLQRKLAEVRSVASNEERVKQEIEALERKLAVALRRLPDDKELPVLLTDITSLGKNSGLDFEAFRPRPEVQRDFYAEVPIGVEFTGRFHDIAAFFDEIARLPRIVNVGELDIEIAEQDSQRTVLEVKGTATTFRFLEKQADADAGAASGGRGRGGK